MNQQFLTWHARLASEGVKGIRSLTDPAARRGAASLLLTLCRNMEDVAPRNVSRRAAERGRELGITDLRLAHWDDGARFPGGRKGSRLYWEHWRPAVDIRTELLSLTDPTPEACEAVLATARVAWILLEENAALDASGVRMRRVDPAAAYAAVGIEMEYPW